jgi:integrase
VPIYKIPGQKKDGLQKYRVVYNYTEHGKKRTKERLVYGKAQADLTEAELCRENTGPNARKGTERKSLTVKGLFDIYEAERGPEIRGSTMAKKRSILGTHVFPAIGKIALSELTEDELAVWRAELVRTERKANTKNGAIKELKALLNFAAERGLYNPAPLKKLKPFRDPYAETSAVKLRYYTKAEFEAFLSQARAAAEKEDTMRAWGIYIFFMLACYTGMRKGEIHALRWTDIDGSYLWVRRSITQKLKGEQWVETPPKNESSVRRLQMPGKLVEALMEHRERAEQMDGWSEKLFICGGPRPIPDTVIENANKRFGAAAGLKHITIHEFRHSHASVLCNAGVNIKEIARRLGHSDVETTLKTYSHLYPTEEERAVKILE